MIHRHQKSSNMIPELMNMTISAKIENHPSLDLRELSMRIRDCRYRPAKFPGLVYRNSRNKCTLLVFKSGNIVAVGSHDPKKAGVAIKKFILQARRALNNQKMRLVKNRFHVYNLMASAKLSYPVNL